MTRVLVISAALWLLFGIIGYLVDIWFWRTRGQPVTSLRLEVLYCVLCIIFGPLALYYVIADAIREGS